MTSPHGPINRQDLRRIKAVSCADLASFRASRIGAVVVAPSDPNIIYVGSGDPIAGGDGDGAYKSTDAGRTRPYIGLEATHRISKSYNTTLTAWKKLQSEELTAFNALLTGSNLPAMSAAPSKLTAASCSFAAAPAARARQNDRAR
jgi:hypothetical protein